MSELISVIIPVYKVEKYLDRCIESVVNQTYGKLEIILVDDGSPDGCPLICDEWAKRDQRVSVIHQENKGLGMARNLGLKIAKGEYLVFLDSDDYLSENAVEIFHSRMIVDHSDMAIGKHVDIYDDGTINDKFSAWINDGVVTNDDVFRKMGDDNRYTVSVWGKMFKRDLFEGVEFPTLKCGEDLWIFPYIIDKCKCISVVDEICYFYYQRVDSIVHQLTQDRLFDDISARIHFSRFLMERGYSKSALKWFEISLSKAMSIRDKKKVEKLFKEKFSAVEIRTLLLSGNLSMKVKWICLYVPVLFSIIHQIKKLVLKKKGNI